MTKSRVQRRGAIASVALIIWACAIIATITALATLAMTGASVNWWAAAATILGSTLILFVIAAATARPRKPRARNVTDHPAGGLSVTLSPSERERYRNFLTDNDRLSGKDSN